MKEFAETFDQTSPKQILKKFNAGELHQTSMDRKSLLLKKSMNSVDIKQSVLASYKKEKKLEDDGSSQKPRLTNEKRDTPPSFNLTTQKSFGNL